MRICVYAWVKLKIFKGTSVSSGHFLTYTPVGLDSGLRQVWMQANDSQVTKLGAAAGTKLKDPYICVLRKVEGPRDLVSPALPWPLPIIPSPAPPTVCDRPMEPCCRRPRRGAHRSRCWPPLCAPRRPLPSPPPPPPPLRPPLSPRPPFATPRAPPPPRQAPTPTPRPRSRFAILGAPAGSPFTLPFPNPYSSTALPRWDPRSWRPRSALWTGTAATTPGRS